MEEKQLTSRELEEQANALLADCLLYTSDAADE